MTLLAIFSVSCMIANPDHTEEYQYITRREMRDMGPTQRFVTHIERKYGLRNRRDFNVIATHYGRGLLSPSNHMYAYLVDGTRETHTFRVSGGTDSYGNARFMDNLAGLFMREELEEWIAEVAEEFFDDVKVFVRMFPPSLPADFNRDSSARDLAGRETGLIQVSVSVSEQFESIEEFETVAEAFLDRWSDEDVNSRLVVASLEQLFFNNRTRENINDPIPDGVVIAAHSRTIWANRPGEENDNE